MSGILSFQGASPEQSPRWPDGMAPMSIPRPLGVSELEVESSYVTVSGD